MTADLPPFVLNGPRGSWFYCDAVKYVDAETMHAALVHHSKEYARRDQYEREQASQPPPKAAIVSDGHGNAIALIREEPVPDTDALLARCADLVAARDKWWREGKNDRVAEEYLTGAIVLLVRDHSEAIAAGYRAAVDEAKRAQDRVVELERALKQSREAFQISARSQPPPPLHLWQQERNAARAETERLLEGLRGIGERAERMKGRATGERPLFSATEACAWIAKECNALLGRSPSAPTETQAPEPAPAIAHSESSGDPLLALYEALDRDYRQWQDDIRYYGDRSQADGYARWCVEQVEKGLAGFRAVLEREQQTEATQTADGFLLSAEITELRRMIARLSAALRARTDLSRIEPLLREADTLAAGVSAEDPLAESNTESTGGESASTSSYDSLRESERVKWNTLLENLPDDPRLREQIDRAGAVSGLILYLAQLRAAREQRDVLLKRYRDARVWTLPTLPGQGDDVKAVELLGLDRGEFTIAIFVRRNTSNGARLLSSGAPVVESDQPARDAEACAELWKALISTVR